MKDMKKVSVAISVLLMLILLIVVNVDVVSAFAGMEQQTPTSTPVLCNEYVALHPEIYPISSCQQIVSSWKNNMTNDGDTHIIVDVGTVVQFSITTNSDIKSANAIVEPNNIVYNSYYGPRIFYSDVTFDKVGHYNVNLRASNSFARGGVTWDVDVIDTVIVLPPKIASHIEMDENSRNELNRLTQTGKHYKLISIKDFAFVPEMVYADQSIIVFIFNEDSITHYVKFSDNNNGYVDIRPGTILGFCCGDNSAGTMIEYQDRDYPSMKGKTLVAIDTVKPTHTPNPTVNPTPVQTYKSEPGPGCWDSYSGFGICAGERIAVTGVSILAGIGKVISDIIEQT